MAESNLIQTGIQGLDDILLGGIPRTNVILVQGAAGTGKTLMGMEFIYRGIVAYDEPGLIVVFETSPDKLIRDAAGFGWNLEDLERRKKLKLIFTSPQVLDQELRSPDSLLLETAAEIGAQRIFIDSIGLLSQAVGNGHQLQNGPASYRDILQQLIEGLNRENLTAMLSHEIGRLPESLASLDMADFLADTLIQLKCSPYRRRGVHRSIEIVKSRGQEYDAGEHTLQIEKGKGLAVYRRVQSPVNRDIAQPTSMARRSVIGVQVLDDLIGGGVFDGSTTMVVGVSGVGKTILATQLLQEGAKKHGKRGLLVSLDEHPAQIVRNAETLGLDLQEQIDSGTIHILFESPQELDVDSHFARIVRAVEENDIQRLVIDGMTSYSAAIEDQPVYRDFFHALVAFSKYRLMTTFFNYENPEVFGISSYMPDFPVSSIVDNIILLSLVELGNTLRRGITVVKARGSNHELDTREFTIGQGGIALKPREQDSGATASAPFPSYASLLSRAPTRFGRRPPRGALPPEPIEE
jgi:circadian clock protein KaiC